MNLLAGLLVGLLLVGFVSASAQMSRGTIENALSDIDSRDCEFVSMQDGVDTPIRFALTFPSTPDVRPEIKGTDPKTEFSSDFNNQGFFFSTNATDLFTIKLHVDYQEPSGKPRLFLYELFTGNGMLNQVGNWNLYGQSFCKILEFNARPAPHILTDDEIVETIAGYEKVQHELTHAKQDETNNMIAVIVIAVVTVSVIGVIVLILMKVSKSRDSANANLATKQFSKQTAKFSSVVEFLIQNTKYQDVKIDSIGKKVEQGFHDVMLAVFHHKEDEKKLAFPKPPIAYVKSSDESVKDNVTAGMSLFDTIKSSFVKKPKIEDKQATLYEVLNEKTTQELSDEYEKMYKHISDYHTDFDFKEKFDIIMKLLKERVEKR